MHVADGKPSAICVSGRFGPFHGWREREPDDNRRAFALNTIDLHVTAMLFGQRAHKRQAKAGACLADHRISRDLFKGAAKAGQSFRWYADAIIAHREHHEFAVTGRLDPDMPA